MTFKRLLFNFVILTNTTGMSHLKVIDSTEFSVMVVG